MKKFHFLQNRSLVSARLMPSVVSQTARYNALFCRSGRPEAVVHINQIIYFVALCEERNFTRAAKRCRISQPSLTNAIKALEDELGGALFTRKPKLELSTFGLAMKPHLRRVVLAFNRALVVANDHRGGRLSSRASDGQCGVEFIDGHRDGPVLQLRQRSKPRGATPRASRGVSRQLPTTLARG